MRTKKNILLTFDYELFLGSRSGTPENCLLEPTDKILPLLSEHKCKAIFFVDTTYLLKLQEAEKSDNRVASNFSKVSEQIQKLVLQGHYVFPHIHPHWADVKYIAKENQWDLSIAKKYRFNSLSVEERKTIFNNSISILNEIILPVKNDYKIDAYRAGGWCIQPFDDFKLLFNKYNLKYDFSVLKGFKSESEINYFDFVNVPDKAVYNFSNDVCMEDSKGDFTEFAISSHRVNSISIFFHKTILKIFSLLNVNRQFGKGLSVKNANINSISNEEMISIELMSLTKLRDYKKFIRKNNYMHFISHPKMFTPHNLSIFKIFLDFVYNNYDVITDFRKMI